MSRTGNYTMRLKIKAEMNLCGTVGGPKTAPIPTLF